MLGACSRNPHCFYYFNITLKLDGDFFKELLEVSPTIYLHATCGLAGLVRDGGATVGDQANWRELIRTRLNGLFQIVGETGHSILAYTKLRNPVLLQMM